jgi:hypothetical protein
MTQADRYRYLFRIWASRGLLGAVGLTASASGALAASTAPALPSPINRATVAERLELIRSAVSGAAPAANAVPNTQKIDIAQWMNWGNWGNFWNKPWYNFGNWGNF